MYPFGVDPTQAPTTVVPGSHRLQGGGPKRTLGPGFVGQGQVEADGNLPHAAMPHALPVTVGPGSALIFDNAIWHTAYPHTGSEPRRYFILGYQSSRARVGDPHAHRPWGLSSGQAEEWAERGLLNQARETLLGMRDGVYVSADVANSTATISSGHTEASVVSPTCNIDCVPFQLPLDEHFPPGSLRAHIQKAQQIAAEARQFRAAAMLDDLAHVLCPRPSSTGMSKYAPPT